MPPTIGAPITPQLGRMSPLPTSDRRGKVVLTFITLTLIVSAIFVRFNSGNNGFVTVLIRAEDGTRTVSALNIGTTALSERADVDSSTVTTQSIRSFYLTDGSTISIDTAGVVQRVGADLMSTRVLVASPAAPHPRTSLAVWGEGSLIAWTSPADNSIQVFEKNDRGAYVPFYLNNDLHPNSLSFTDSGDMLIVAILGGASTDIVGINLKNGAIKKITTLDGLVSVVPTL
jgi:hypothetical protein